MDQPRPALARELATSAVEAARKALGECDIPLVGLYSALPVGVPCRLTGWEGVDGAITHVEITYGDSRTDQPWIVVGTSRWAGTKVSSGPLRAAVEHFMRRHGDHLVGVDWQEGSTTIKVDDLEIGGHFVSAGARWRGVRCEREGVEITVVSRDCATDPSLETLRDIEPLLAQLEAEPRPSAPADEEPLPEGLSSDPHRALVDVSLQVDWQHAKWRSTGGPAPAPIAGMSSMRGLAVERQMLLTDQSEPQARQSVSSMVAQLVSLQQRADWFRENAQLRNRAINETLLFGTGLDSNVASRRAQIAWGQHQGDMVVTDYSDVVRYADAEREWADGWDAWFAAQG